MYRMFFCIAKYGVRFQIKIYTLFYKYFLINLILYYVTQNIKYEKKHFYCFLLEF
jgi:hypothetical protein